MVYLGKFVKGKAVSSTVVNILLALDNRLEAHLHQDPPPRPDTRGLGSGAKTDEVEA
jgi:hypothetical protein